MVNPSIYTGDSITGYGADPLQVGYRKYNQHVHDLCLANFLYEPINIGDSVEFYINGRNVIQYSGVNDNPAVTGLSFNALQISTQARESGVGTLIINNKVYRSIASTLGSNLLTIVSTQAGFLSPEGKQAGQFKTYQSTVSVTTSNPLVLDPQSTTDLIAVLSQQSPATPAQAIPVLIKTPRMRLVNLHLLPQWSSTTQSRGVLVRFAINSTAFNYIGGDLNLSNIGITTMSLGNHVTQNSALYIQLFNPVNITRLTYQLDTIAI